MSIPSRLCSCGGSKLHAPVTTKDVLATSVTNSNLRNNNNIRSCVLSALHKVVGTMIIRSLVCLIIIGRSLLSQSWWLIRLCISYLVWRVEIINWYLNESIPIHCDYLAPVFYTVLFSGVSSWNLGHQHDSILYRVWISLLWCWGQMRHLLPHPSLNRTVELGFRW